MNNAPTKQEAARPVGYMNRLTRPPLHYPAQRYDALLSHAAAQFPFRPALVQDGWSLSYAAYDSWVNAVANTLQSRWGIGPGDVVAVSVALCIEAAIAYMAVVRAGATVTPINPLHNAPEDIAHQLDHAKPRLCIGCTETYPSLCSLFESENVLWYGVSDAALPLDFNMIDVAAGFSTQPPADRGVTPDAIAAIPYTSGTIGGTPKGVKLSHRNLVANAMQFASAQCLSERDTMLNGLPLLVSMHLGGAIAAGATMVLAHRANARQLLRLASDTMATQMYVGAPVILEMGGMQDLEGWRTPWLKSITGAAAKLPPSILEHVRRSLDISVVQGYGLTEAAPFTHTHPVFRGYVPPAGCCGLVGPDTEQRIVHVDTGKVLPLGRQHVGELQVRGPQVMKEYLNDPVRSAEVFSDGWLRSGDIAAIDEEGYLYYGDRMADVIRRGEHYVIPLDLEFLARSQSSVRDCAVIGVPRADGAQDVVAFVVLKPVDPTKLEAQPTEESLRCLINMHVPASQSLDRVAFVPTLPRSGIGKLLRRVVRAQATGTTTAEHA